MGKDEKKQVLKFRNRGVPKGTPEEDNVSNESPKISFRWEAENSSTISSSISMPPSSLKNDHQTEAATALSLNATPLHQRDQAPKRGNWITTDSECKALILVLFSFFHMCIMFGLKLPGITLNTD